MFHVKHSPIIRYRFDPLTGKEYEPKRSKQFWDEYTKGVDDLYAQRSVSQSPSPNPVNPDPGTSGL